jgi:hypothetical protein
MNYNFRIFLLLGFLLLNPFCIIHARIVILLTFDQSEELAMTAKKLVMEQEQIPETLIVLKKMTMPCVPQRALVHLCIDNEGHLHAPFLEREQYVSTLKIFKQGRIENE